MCGIVGFVDKSKNKEKIIKSMIERIKHRGPDENGFYINNDTALGHVRLSIIDLATGSQPMFSADNNYSIIYNGEMYNYQELKKELITKGYKFNNNSDTEVLLNSYIEYGEKCLSKFRGMFAFVIYDKKKDTLFGARDYFGIKPLYYYKTNDTFMFSSEIKAFLSHPLFKKELNENVLPEYLSFNFVPNEETFFKDVYKLAPGHFFTYKNNKFKIESYFDFKFDEENIEFDEAVNKIGNVMEDSVIHHNISDVQVGSFLSSGVDSSYIVSLSKPNLTFTIGYKEKGFSELNYAQDLAKRLNIKNKYKIISKKEYFDSLEKVVYHLDEPLADPSAIALYFLAQLASKDLKVVLSGEGADELFGGYNYYLDEVNHSFYNKIPFNIRKVISKVASVLPAHRYINFLVRRGQTLEEGYIGVNKVFNEKERNEILLNKTTRKNKDITKPVYSKIKNQSNLAKMQTIDVIYWLQKDILLKSDKMAMANSIEVRVPFLDKDVYEVARTLPQNVKLSESKTKIALREAARKVIPNESYNKKKLGFPVPLKEWIKTEDVYSKMKKTFNSDISKKLFDNNAINKLLDLTYTGRIDNYKKAWTIYIFLIWYQVFFEN